MVFKKIISPNVQGTGRDLTQKPKQEGIQVNISSERKMVVVTSQVLRKARCGTR
jgi:hypothetical protein